MRKTTKTSNVVIRVKQQERKILQNAAERTDVRLSDIVRDGALAYARQLLAPDAEPARPERER